MTFFDIKRAVADCRARYPALAESRVPIDMVHFLEVDLKIDLLPVPGLFNRHRVDAAILQDFSSIYVDEQSYASLDSTCGWMPGRLQFTLAHEFAHLILHRGNPAALKFTSVSNYTLAVCNINRRIENEADEFAGQLLVPTNILRAEFSSRHIPPSMLSNTNARQYYAYSIAPRFGVNGRVVEIRLKNEGLWPDCD